LSPPRNHPAAKGPRSSVEVLGGTRLKSLLVRTLIPFGLLLIAFLLLALNVGFDEFRAALGNVRLETVALMLAASAFNYLARSARWVLLLRSVNVLEQGNDLRALPKHFLVYLAGYAFTMTPGRAGEAVRAWMAHRSFGVPVEAGLSLVIADRFYDAVALTVILSLAALTTAKYPLAAGIMVIILTCAVLILGRIRPSSALWHRIADAVPRLSTPIAWLRDMIAHLSSVSRPSKLPIFASPSIAGWLVQGLVPAIAIRDMGLELSISDSILVFAMATLIGGASFLPGGLGGFEATMIGLLVAMDVPAATAVAATLVIRLTTLWFGVLLGIAMLLIWTISGAGRRNSSNQNATR
jgi:uncharacterized protein (TIRG00374 family)